MGKSLLPLGHRPPLLDESMETLLRWLEEREYLAQAENMDLLSAGPAPALDAARRALQGPASERHPIKPLGLKERSELKKRLAGAPPRGVANESVWAAHKQAHAGVRTLEWNRQPADAMAFYCPFHHPPLDHWGIYLLIEPLLKNMARLESAVADLRLYSPEVLAHLVLFEVFQHQYFHHVAESAATYLEILYTPTREKRPVFLDYRARSRSDGYGHPHAPLEEALANAHAHQELGQLMRDKPGYKNAVVHAYRLGLERSWPREPAGYRDAAAYLGAGFVDGGATLLAQMLGAPAIVDEAPFACVAKHLMPNGLTALVAKSDIPTYLVGSAEQIAAFRALIPAPKEACISLFWPYDTSAIDSYLTKMAAAERREKRAEKARTSESQKRSSVQDVLL